MSNQDQDKSSTDVPRRVFEEFLKRLEEDKMPAAAVDRLRALLLSEKSLTEKTITDALLSENPLV